MTQKLIFPLFLTMALGSIFSQAATPLDNRIEIEHCLSGMKLKYRNIRPWYSNHDVRGGAGTRVIDIYNFDKETGNKGVTKVRAAIESRVIHIYNFHKQIGKKDVIADSVFASAPTSTVKFDLTSPRGFFWQAQDINWRSQMGTKVAMEFKSHDKTATVSQTVTGSEYLRGLELEAVQEILSVPNATESDKGLNQKGIIMALTTDGVVSSELFGVEDDEEFNFRVAGEEAKKIHDNVHPLGQSSILKIIYARTFIGRGTPLDENDSKFLRALMEMFPNAQVKIIGVPSDDHGYVAFEMRSP